jgi:hypothetical protein
MRIDGNGLITGTGTSLGAWTAYTPTLGGSGWAIGDGTAVGAYCQIGKVVAFRARITFGSTSTFGAGQPNISLPVTLRSAHGGVIGRTRFVDTSLAANYGTDTLVASTTTVVFRTLGTNGLEALTTSSVPFTWASTDLIDVNGVYEIA